MLIATIKYPGIFIDKPNIDTISVDETAVAMEKKDEATGRFNKLTVKELFLSFQSRTMSLTVDTEDDQAIDHTYFEMWFYEKHLRTKPYHNRILSMTFVLE